jgi:hypothetical protein
MSARHARIDLGSPTDEEVRHARLRCFVADVRDRRAPYQLAGDDAVRPAKALCYVLDVLEARRRGGKSVLGMDETVRMLVDGLKGSRHARGVPAVSGIGRPGARVNRARPGSRRRAYPLVVTEPLPCPEVARMSSASPLPTAFSLPLDSLPPLERLLVEQALLMAQEVRAATAAAPPGHVLARGEDAAITRGRELTRQALQAALQEHIDQLEKKVPPPAPAPVATGGGTKAPTRGRC